MQVSLWPVCSQGTRTTPSLLAASALTPIFNFSCTVHGNRFSLVAVLGLLPLRASPCIVSRDIVLKVAASCVAATGRAHRPVSLSRFVEGNLLMHDHQMP